MSGPVTGSSPKSQRGNKNRLSGGRSGSGEVGISTTGSTALWRLSHKQQQQQQHQQQQQQQQQQHQLAAWPGGRISSRAASAGQNHAVRPRFLRELEDDLAKELRLRGCPPCGPDIARLQVHREIFARLIAEFTTYKELLSQIRVEYECSLDDANTRLEELSHLKARLATLEDEHARDVARVRAEMRTHIEDNQAQLLALKHAQSSASANRTAEENTATRLRSELKKARAEAEHERAARKQLIADIHAAQLESDSHVGVGGGASSLKVADLAKLDLSAVDVGGDGSGGGIEFRGGGDSDAVIAATEVRELRIELDHYKELYRKAKAREASRATAIPLDEHEKVVYEAKGYLQERDAALANISSLMAEYGALTSLAKETRAQRDQARAQVAELTTALREAETKLVGRTVEVMPTSSSYDSLPPLSPHGMGQDVLPHLKWNQPVPDRALSLRELQLLLKDVRNEQNATAAAATSAAATSHDGDSSRGLGSFLLQYFESKFKGPATVAEWCYNVHVACERYGHVDEFVRRAAAALNGGGSEDEIAFLVS